MEYLWYGDRSVGSVKEGVALADMAVLSGEPRAL